MFDYIKNFINSNQLWIGAILGWIISRMMEMLQKPKIEFVIIKDHEFTRNSRKFKFINLTIRNSKQNFLSKFFFGNQNLNNSRVWLTFKDYNSRKEILKANGRWASTREPIDYSSGQPLIPEILIPSRETIPQGEEANISIAIKENGDDSFFLFNNESYLHNWKNPDFELKDNKYWLKIRLLADGHEYTKEFLLSNPSKSLKNFKVLEK
ncbi:MAG: hypothetical protein H6772_02210 [Pseudomonadales bacterium]|nr:hypothetical protein [Pseudomonadales bacterium]